MLILETKKTWFKHRKLITMDTHASMEAHVNNVSRTAYYHLYNIGRIRCYLSQSAAEQLVHAFITSKLDYCNALLCGLPSLLTKKLQRIQNAAARIITRTRRSAHREPRGQHAGVHRMIVIRRDLATGTSLDDINPSCCKE